MTDYLTQKYQMVAINPLLGLFASQLQTIQAHVDSTQLVVVSTNTTHPLDISTIVSPVQSSPSSVRAFPTIKEPLIQFTPFPNLPTGLPLKIRNSSPQSRIISLSHDLGSKPSYLASSLTFKTNTPSPTTYYSAHSQRIPLYNLTKIQKSHRSVEALLYIDAQGDTLYFPFPAILSRTRVYIFNPAAMDLRASQAVRFAALNYHWLRRE
jgi:hypothetical protein